jgi:hypothetical protein
MSILVPAQPRLWSPLCPPSKRRLAIQEQERERTERHLWNRLRQCYPWASARRITELLVAYSLTLTGCTKTTAAAGTLPVDLVSFWEFEETTGGATRVDATGRLNDLSPTGSPTGSAGKVGNAVDLDGSTKYLRKTYTSDFDFSSGDWTIVCWVKLNATTSFQRIIQKADSTPNNDWGLIVNNSAKFALNVVNTTPASIFATDTTVLSTGVWYFVVGWRSTSDSDYFISVNNATPIAHGTGAGALATRNGTGRDLGVGIHGGSTTNHLDGSVDQVGLWKRKLTANERTGAGLTYAQVVAASF